MRFRAAISILVTGCVLLASCATDSPSHAVAPDPGVLRVGVNANTPPMIFKEGGRLEGVEVDLAAALGKELGRKVVFVEEIA